MTDYNNLYDDGAEDIKPRLSCWFITDIAVCLLIPFFCFILMTGFAYSYVMQLAGWFPVPLIIIILNKKRYYKTYKRSKAAAAVAVFLRTVLYPAVIFAAVLPFTMKADIPWYYPVQREVYFSNYQSGVPKFMPDSIPDNAEDYNAEFVPGILQSDGMIMIYFRTDEATLDKYRQFAKENGGVRQYEDNMLSWPRNYGADIADSCEVYMLPHVYGHHPVYYICTESGYFVLYW